MGKKLLFLVLILFANYSFAQLHEFGPVIGGSNYVGDIGSSTLIRPNAPAFGLLYRYNRNPRIAYRASFTRMKIIANDSESNNEIQKSFDLSINKTITEFTGGIDFNFLEYNVSHWKKAHTPYLIFELGLFHYKTAQGTLENTTYQSQIGIALPFGFGYKVQVSNNLVLGLEARIRYSFTDDLDDSQFHKEETLKYNSENSKFGNPDTNDWYSFTGLTITYTFGKAISYTTRRR